MVDDGYDPVEGTFSSLGSLFAEVDVGRRLLQHEVRVAGRQNITLSSFQRRLWKAIDDYDRVGVSAPTSAGKSFVLAHKIVDLACSNGGDIVYIVPTLSLISQVTRDIKDVIRRNDVKGLNVYQTVSDRLRARGDRSVFVLTQERAQSALLREEAFKNLFLLVVDEVQNVERIANQGDERARVLLDVVRDVDSKFSPQKAVVCGPLLKNIGELSKSLLGEGARTVSENLPPVVNLTYSFTSRRGGKVFLRQHCPIHNAPLEVELPEGAVPKSIFGKQYYKEPLFDLLTQVIEGIGKDAGNLVFSPTTNQARRTACALEARNHDTVSNEPLLTDLRAYIAETVHPNYSLAKTVESRIGYHHGKMPRHVRMAVEDAFSAGALTTVACTTTLLQGVNLPAKNLIVRNPHLFLQRRSDRDNVSLSSYEFSNLRGRTGRLMKDFVGRAIVLDETLFQEQGLELSKDAKKDVNSSYEERFQAQRKSVLDVLLDGEPISRDVDGADLAIYIRQAVLRDGEEGRERLATVGIRLSDLEYTAVRKSLAQLGVARDVCKQFRYWDPFVLDMLYRANAQGRLEELPKSPLSDDFFQSLLRLIQQLEHEAPSRFNRHLGSASGKFLRALAVTARDWASEKPWAELIDWADKGLELNEDSIEQKVQMVLKYVSHELPKLLGPISYMQDPDNPLLSCLEFGAFRPVTRRLIEYGLPRETAVRISMNISSEALLDVDQDVSDERGLRMATKQVASALFQWEQLQISSLLD
ncbi:DEAD/DEAH box helicase [Persicimonas caeni]|nr:DEAD/DEAH box helicase [Persicimonas caeni]